MYDNEKSWMKVQGSLWLFQTIFLLLPLFLCKYVRCSRSRIHCNNSSNFCFFFFLFILWFSLSPNRYFATFPKMLWKQRRLMKQFELATFLAFLRFYPIFANCAVTNSRLGTGKNPLWKIISHYVYYWKWRAENFRENTILPPILLYIFRSCWKIARSAFIKLLLIGYSVFSKLGLENTIELLQLAISLLH